MASPLELLIAASPYLPRWVVEAARSGRDLETPRRLEGTVLVCDLAGFADTTHRLTEQGAVGPEATLELLNGWFRAVLEPVSDAEGDIVSFAGDSFTALFEGAHPEERLGRAIRAGQQIVESDAAGVRIGIASGEVTLGVVGSSASLHPVILGPAARLAALAMQTTRIDSLQLAEGDRFRELIPRERDTTLPRRLLDYADEGATANSAASLVGSPRQILERLRPFLPPTVWEGLLHPRAAGEHRPAVTLFARIGLAGGPHLPLAELEPALSRAILLLERVGGHVQKIDTSDKGVVLLAFFGVPTVTPNAVPRAAEVALGLAEEFGMGVALTTGRIFAGDLGGRLRHEFSAVGEPVNRAARILQTTPPGEVYCDPELAAELVGVSSNALPPLEAKGFPEPIPVTRLGGGVSGEFVAFAEERSPLLGRDAELERILDHCRRQATVTGGGLSPRGLLIAGEMGIGKSRLVREGARQLRQDGFRVAVAHFGRYRAFRTLQELGGALGIEATTDRGLILERLGAAFAAGPGKVIVVIEDLHLAGEDDLQLIREALPSLLLTGGTLLCTTRPGFDFPGLGERIALGTLERTAALALVRHHAPEITLGEAETIVRRGGGVPLFLEQLAMSADAGAAEIPATVEDAIRGRLESLDPIARKLLASASIAPPVFDFSAFEPVVAEEGKEPVRQALRRLLELGVVRAGPGRTYRFAHDLERTVVHDTLSFAQREALHRKALMGLEQRGGSETAEAFEHLEALGEREAAGRAAMAAAREAGRVRADWEMIRLARIAVERLRDPEDLCRAEGLVAHGLQYAADWRASNDLAGQVEARARRLGLTGEAIWMAVVQAGNLSFLSDHRASEEALERALAAAPLPEEHLPRIEMIRGWNAWGRGLFREAREHLERALTLADPASPLGGSVLTGLISVLILLGELTEALRRLPPIEAMLKYNPYHFLFDRMDIAALQADAPLLRKLLQETVRLQETQPAGTRLVHETEVLRAFLFEMEGRWEEATAARDFSIATNQEIESYYDVLDLLLDNLCEALLAGHLEASVERCRVLGELAEVVEAGDQSARAQVLGATAALLSGEVRRNLPDLIYRNRRFAERSARWELILNVETLAALAEEDPEVQRTALSKLCEDCAQRGDRRGERSVRLLAWRRAQTMGDRQEAERRWVALTDCLDTWGVPRWTFGARLCPLPEGLPALTSRKDASP